MASTATATLPVRRALMAAAVEAIADATVSVTVGIPAHMPDDAIIFGQIRGAQDNATLGPKRSRNETLTFEMVISVYRQGAQDDEAVSDRAYDLLALIERRIRNDDPTLGGTCLWAQVTAHTSDVATPDDVLHAGRLCELSVTFTAMARISG